MTTKLTYMWVVIYRNEEAELLTAFGPFDTFEQADEFPTPPGVEPSEITVTRLHEAFEFEERAF